MEKHELESTELLNSTKELRQLIIDNPDLPLLVFAGDEANPGDEYGHQSCSKVSACVGEFLDCWTTVNGNYCYADREEFQEDLENTLCDNFIGSDKEFEQFIKSEMEKYEPYWRPCIILLVDN